MWIYSENKDSIIMRGFFLRGKHFTWNEADERYYCDETDEISYEEIPKSATLE
jgi:hypothetical protein